MINRAKILAATAALLALAGVAGCGPADDCGNTPQGCPGAITAAPTSAAPAPVVDAGAPSGVPTPTTTLYSHEGLALHWGLYDTTTQAGMPLLGYPVDVDATALPYGYGLIDPWTGVIGPGHLNFANQPSSGTIAVQLAPGSYGIEFVLTVENVPQAARLRCWSTYDGVASLDPTAQDGDSVPRGGVLTVTCTVREP